MAWPPATSAWRVLGNGLSPICSSMTSLPRPFKRLATASTSKAVSALRPRAKSLSVRGEVVMGEVDCIGRLYEAAGSSLFGSNGLGQRADHRRNDVLVHQFLDGLALVLVRLAEGLV